MNITIGEIVKAQGIKGEIKVKPLTDDILRFKKLKEVIIKGTAYDIVAMRISEGFVFLSLGGVADRTRAESFVGLNVEIDRADAVDLPENTYFVADMLGCEVFLSDGSRLGKVDYIYQNGAADVYEVKGEANVMFPFLNEIVVSIDIAQKKMILDKERFARVAVYED